MKNVSLHEVGLSVAGKPYNLLICIKSERCAPTCVSKTQIKSCSEKDASHFLTEVPSIHANGTS